MVDIQKNILAVKQTIRACEVRYDRTPNSVSLLAVSKTQSAENILLAAQTGQVAFAENYLQEALPKIQQLADENLEWHFIGPLQSNKTKKIAANFSWVHSVSQFAMAKYLNDYRPAHLPPLNICLQVNVSVEPTKAGIPAADLIQLAKECLLLPRIKLRGLMCIPAATDNFAEQRQPFNKLLLLKEKLEESGIKTDTLSMGMTNDMEAAIAEGSTMVRIGTKIFGRR